MREIHIGEIIKQRRLELGLTQEELCEGICEPPTMSRIEKGRQTPTHSKLKALLSRLGLPSEKYYALLSENELKIERLKDEIINYNARRLFREALEKIDELSQLIEKDDHISQQFILRSKVLSGKIENGNHTQFSEEEKQNLLYQAIRITIPDFDIDEIGSHWYSLNEIKIINQIAIAYSDNNQRKVALDIFYQLMKHIKKKFIIHSDNVSNIILISYNYALALCREKRYSDAIEIAEWGWSKSVEWARASNLGGLFYVLGESHYHIGDLTKSKFFFLQAYYAYQMMKSTNLADMMSDYIRDHFGEEI